MSHRPALDPSFEEMDVIDADDRPYATASKREIYSRRLSHRIVHVFVLRGRDVFIQKRGEAVSYLPGHYCTSAGGHVHAGEHPDAAAVRELNEELGLAGPPQPVAQFWYAGECRTRISLYATRMSGADRMRLCPREVAGGEFVPLDAVDRLDRALWHPQLEPCLAHLRTWLARANE